MYYVTLLLVRLTIVVVENFIVLDTEYSGCIYVALDIQQATRMCRIFICGLPDYTIFSHII